MATISGEWSGTIGDTSNPLTWHSYTVTEGGEYTVEATIAADATHVVSVYLDGDNIDPLFLESGEGEVTGSAIVTLSAGVSLDFISYGTEAVPGTGTWSISSDVLAPDLPPNAVPVGSIDGVYYGATLAQALYHGSALLWGIHGTITPDPPVFLEEDPWITLPAVEHVTYQVSGTPGAGQSVTVTAVPDEGWVLDGDTIWAHEWESDINPYELGAIHWLPFNDDPLEDIGTAPSTWQGYDSPTISDGALVSGRITFPTSSTYDPTNGSTVAGWVRNTATSTPYGDPPLSASASFSEITFWVNSADAARWRFRRGGAGAQIIITGTVPDEWAFIAACMEPVSGTTWRYRAYINGTEVLNDTYDAGTQSAVTFNSAAFDAARADVSDAAIYNHALTPQDIADLHDAGRTT